VRRESFPRPCRRRPHRALLSYQWQSDRRGHVVIVSRVEGSRVFVWNPGKRGRGWQEVEYTSRRAPASLLLSAGAVLAFTAVWMRLCDTRNPATLRVAVIGGVIFGAWVALQQFGP
jgi:hypothetical protein